MQSTSLYFAHFFVLYISVFTTIHKYQIISRPVSRVMSWMVIYLGLLLPTASSDLPESKPGRLIAFFLVLLRMGFTCAPVVTNRAVVSYTALPPLLLQSSGIFLLHWPWSRLHRTLSGILPCEARTFLIRQAYAFCCDHPAYLSLLLYYILDVEATSAAKFTYQ